MASSSALSIAPTRELCCWERDTVPHSSITQQRACHHPACHEARQRRGPVLSCTAAASPPIRAKPMMPTRSALSERYARRPSEPAEAECLHVRNTHMLCKKFGYKQWLISIFEKRRVSASVVMRPFCSSARSQRVDRGRSGPLHAMRETRGRWSPPKASRFRSQWAVRSAPPYSASA
jgi:hypothetical protein